jgi:hypothetical protein
LLPLPLPALGVAVGMLLPNEKVVGVGCEAKLKLLVEDGAVGVPKEKPSPDKLKERKRFVILFHAI